METGDILKHRALIAKEGWIFILLFAFLALIFLLIRIWFIGVPLAGLTLFTVYFFRNPERLVPEGNNLITSPADGTILSIQDIENNRFTGFPAKKISIFMSVFNVHVNRAPVSGTVKDIVYSPGKFLVASRDKASDDNEKNAIIFEAGHELPIAMVQIAGLVARRIVCYLKMGNNIAKGQRVGMIRFGSRVDLYLPQTTLIDISVGEKVKAGSTIIGRFHEE